MSGPADRPVAIVTGGTHGIGAGIVAAYRERGWAVAVVARQVEAATDPGTLAIAADITQPGSADRIVSETLDRFGRIDTLVNDAGIYISKAFTDYTDQDYDTIVALNLTGWFWLTQRVVPPMVTAGRGHIVNITTTLVDFAVSGEPSVLTSLTKGGLAAATRSLAIEYARHGIRVNAVSPGLIQTGLNPPAEDLGPRTPPLGHLGQISDVVGGIMYLESAPYVTGEIVHVDGGRIAGR
jgi:NAD(P)-dependent dehydrogenase (short-subunit alcohol dehydrogenase family)